MRLFSVFDFRVSEAASQEVSIFVQVFVPNVNELSLGGNQLIVKTRAAILEIEVSWFRMGATIVSRDAIRYQERILFVIGRNDHIPVRTANDAVAPVMPYIAGTSFVPASVRVREEQVVGVRMGRKQQAGHIRIRDFAPFTVRLTIIAVGSRGSDNKFRALQREDPHKLRELTFVAVEQTYREAVYPVNRVIAGAEVPVIPFLLGIEMCLAIAVKQSAFFIYDGNAVVVVTFLTGLVILFSIGYYEAHVVGLGNLARMADTRPVLVFRHRARADSGSRVYPGTYNSGKDRIWTSNFRACRTAESNRFMFFSPAPSPHSA